jgi:hypothetical protein
VPANIATIITEQTIRRFILFAPDSHGPQISDGPRHSAGDPCVSLIGNPPFLYAVIINKKTATIAAFALIGKTCENQISRQGAKAQRTHKLFWIMRLLQLRFAALRLGVRFSLMFAEIPYPNIRTSESLLLVEAGNRGRICRRSNRHPVCLNLMFSSLELARKRAKLNQMGVLFNIGIARAQDWGTRHASETR